MSSLSSERLLALPFCVLGKRLFSVRLPLAVHDLSLVDALTGREHAPLQTLPARSAGRVLCHVPDPGWRTYTVYDDRVTCVLVRDSWHYLSLAGSYEDFLASRYSIKSRESFARDEARFAERCGGALDLREYRGPAALPEFRRLVGLVEEGRPTHADQAAERRRPTAETRGYVLFAADQPVAWMRLQVVGDVCLYGGAGEAEAFRGDVLATILHLQVIRRLFADQSCRYLDYRPGDGELKRQFANGVLRSAVLVDLRPSLFNRLLLRGLAGERRRAFASRRPDAAGMRAFALR